MSESPHQQMRERLAAGGRPRRWEGICEGVPQGDEAEALRAEGAAPGKAESYGNDCQSTSAPRALFSSFLRATPGGRRSPIDR